jgi:hypothetical protein
LMVGERDGDTALPGADGARNDAVAEGGLETR